MNENKYNKYAKELQEKLVKTIIDFMVENNINDVDWVTFGIDGLIESIKEKRWTPYSDSSIELYD